MWEGKANCTKWTCRFLLMVMPIGWKTACSQMLKTLDSKESSAQALSDGSDLSSFWTNQVVRLNSGWWSSRKQGAGSFCAKSWRSSRVASFFSPSHSACPQLKINPSQIRCIGLLIWHMIRKKEIIILLKHNDSEAHPCWIWGGGNSSECWSWQAWENPWVCWPVRKMIKKIVRVIFFLFFFFKVFSGAGPVGCVIYPSFGCWMTEI